MMGQPWRKCRLSNNLIFFSNNTNHWHRRGQCFGFKYMKSGGGGSPQSLPPVLIEDSGW